MYHHVFQDATRPASQANPQSIALNTKGDVVYACKATVNTPSSVEQITSRIMRYVVCIYDCLINTNSKIFIEKHQ